MKIRNMEEFDRVCFFIEHFRSTLDNEERVRVVELPWQGFSCRFSRE